MEDIILRGKAYHFLFEIFITKYPSVYEDVVFTSEWGWECVVETLRSCEQR
jgi:hypothetical protein